MVDCTGKKLLVIGGAFQHCKVVEAAKEMGVTVYVTDYLDVKDAPAKQIADKWYMHNITDIDEIAAMCRQERIDGVIALCLDACQRPYQQICEKLGVPCFGDSEQFRLLTDKNAFKSCCREYGVDVIPEYKPEDFADEQTCARQVQFPILIKPCDSRGSRGQSICGTYQEAVEAIAFARSESASGQIVIEKYMGNKNDFSMSYIMIDGEAYLTRTGDRYLGAREDGLDKLAIAGISPSVYSDFYMEKVNSRVVNMLKGIGLKNGPVFMQGFVDGDTVRFYDPGLRFPGIEYERMYEAACGVNVIKPLIEYALTGTISPAYKAIDPAARLCGKVANNLLVALRPGTIARVVGEEAVRSHPCVVSMFTKYGPGDTVGPHHNVNQRFCEIDIVCADLDEMKQTVEWIYQTLRVEDAQGENMITSRLDTGCFERRKENCQ